MVGIWIILCLTATKASSSEADFNEWDEEKDTEFVVYMHDDFAIAPSITVRAIRVNKGSETDAGSLQKEVDQVQKDQLPISTPTAPPSDPPTTTVALSGSLLDSLLQQEERGFTSDNTHHVSDVAHRDETKKEMVFHIGGTDNQPPRSPKNSHYRNGMVAIDKVTVPIGPSWSRETRTFGGCQWIMLIFADGAKVWYIQPRYGRAFRNRADVWMRGRMGMNGLVPGGDQEFVADKSRYPEQLLITRPRVEGDDDFDVDYVRSAQIVTTLATVAGAIGTALIAGAIAAALTPAAVVAAPAAGAGALAAPLATGFGPSGTVYFASTGLRAALAAGFTGIRTYFATTVIPTAARIISSNITQTIIGLVTGGILQSDAPMRGDTKKSGRYK